jgi:hypothetical protein
MRRGCTPAQVRDSLSAAFLGLSLIGAAVLAPVLLAGDEHVRWAPLAAGLASVVVGHAVGRRTFPRLQGRRYEPLLLAIALAAGALSIAAGVTGAT